MAQDDIAARFLGTEPIPGAFVDNTRTPLGIEPEPAPEAVRDPFPSLSLMQQPARGFTSVAVVRRVQPQEEN